MLVFCSRATKHKVLLIRKKRYWLAEINVQAGELVGRVGRVSCMDTQESIDSIDKYILTNLIASQHDVMYSTVQYSTVQYSTVQYSTVLYIFKSIILCKIFSDQQRKLSNCNSDQQTGPRFFMIQSSLAVVKLVIDYTRTYRGSAEVNSTSLLIGHGIQIGRASCRERV